MSKSLFVCSSCGGESLKWQGRCAFCGAWNTLREVKAEEVKVSPLDFGKAGIEELAKVSSNGYQRLPTGMLEFDRVLGGGLVPGCLILLGGEPGIGKSTLLLQMAEKLSKKNKKVLYVSGEESKEQIKLRASRLKIKAENIDLLCDIDINLVTSVIAQRKYPVVVIDSIQTMYDENYPSTSGSIIQVRECALKLQHKAKNKKVAIIITGHVTKEGAVAGPKILEHLVDVVLYLEGDRFKDIRILHGVKNRFGATEEVGVFEMQESGLFEVANPSRLFLEKPNTPGSAITVILTGKRIFLVEVQALLSKTFFGYPKRTVSGFDLRRLDLLLAVLQKKTKLPLSQYDVYVNIVGGLKVEDRAADLAVCAAISSAFHNKPILEKTVLYGELGLLGEIREVTQAQKRLKEAKMLGYRRAIGPEYKTLERALAKALEP